MLPSQPDGSFLYDRSEFHQLRMAQQVFNDLLATFINVLSAQQLNLRDDRHENRGALKQFGQFIITIQQVLNDVGVQQ